MKNNNRNENGYVSIDPISLIQMAWDGVTNGGPFGKATGGAILLCVFVTFNAFSGGSANKSDVCVQADEAAWFSDWDDGWVKVGCTWNKLAMFIGRDHVSDHSLEAGGGSANE